MGEGVTVRVGVIVAVGNGVFVGAGVAVGVGVTPQAVRAKPNADAPDNLKNSRRVRCGMLDPFLLVRLESVLHEQWRVCELLAACIGAKSMPIWHVTRNPGVGNITLTTIEKHLP